MKLAFVLPSLGFGGAERVVCNLANELSRVHSVSIITMTKKASPAYPLSENVDLLSPDTELPALKNWMRFRNICKQIKPDVVIAFMTNMGIMSSLFLVGTRFPVIVSERNDPFVERKEASLTMRILGKLSSLFIAGYVFQSEGAKSYYSKAIQKRSCIILNPLNVDDLPEREPEKIDNRIVTVGRLHPQKNHKMLIKAFAASKAKDTHTLHIYGDGELRAELESLIDALDMGDKIFLEGNSKQVHTDIKNAKLFVFTSDREGLPNALMEAMAIGLPCISTDCSPGGARMLIENDKNGILIPCGDAERLTCELDELCRDQEKLYELGNNARTIRQKANIGTVVDAWEAFIKSIVNNN